MSTSDMEERPAGDWGRDIRRAPDVAEGDEILFSEHGRIIGDIDYRSHYFRVVKAKYGGALFLVKHGGGQEQFRLDYSAKLVSKLFAKLDSDERYLLMHTFWNVYSHSRAFHVAETETRYQQAFASGKLKKRKIRGSSAVKVWIEG